MKEHPIIFSAPMVRAILDGRKTVTRRVMREQPPAAARYVHEAIGEMPKGWSCRKFYMGPGLWAAFDSHGSHLSNFLVRCPYGVAGDHLWVREAFSYGSTAYAPGCMKILYKADGTSLWRFPPESLGRASEYVGTNLNKPSIHMRRWAARIILERITDAPPERLQDIPLAQAIAEGFPSIEAFRVYWDTLAQKRGDGWDMNRWVWVPDFKLLEVKA